MEVAAPGLGADVDIPIAVDVCRFRLVAPLAVQHQVLGPSARRRRLCEMAKCEASRVFGPVGLDIGAELPAAIALSLAAEIHAVLNGRDGRSLTARGET